jgi:thiamine biosynthesis lipoprotein
VDPTLVGELEAAGYDRSLRGPGLALRDALATAPPRAPALPHPAARWRQVSVDDRAGLIRRPPGVLFDSGGVAKGLFADILAARLSAHEAYAVDCGGDIRLGGTAQRVREVAVSSPFDDAALHRFELAGGGIATSGIGRRSWLGPGGTPCHHLLDPATGRPAFTGIVQATALAPTGVLAETLAKAAVLSGPERAPLWLPFGGLLVRDDGSHHPVSAVREASIQT